MKANETLYAGEAQLAGWSDTHTGGPKLTVWLPSSDHLDKFRALTMRKGNTAGHRVMLAIVEVGDDEQPVPPPKGTKAADPVPKAKNGPYCIEAIDLCRNELFQKWVTTKFDEEELKGEYTDYTPEMLAKEFILMECGVGSRKLLDQEPEAGVAFVNLVRIPFLHWQREQVEGDDDDRG